MSRNTIHNVIYVNGQRSSVCLDFTCKREREREREFSHAFYIIFLILPNIAHSSYSQCVFSRHSGKHETSTTIRVMYTRDTICTYMHCSYRLSQSPIQLTASKWSKLTFERVAWYKGENLTCPTFQVVNAYHCIPLNTEIWIFFRIILQNVSRHPI